MIQEIHETDYGIIYCSSRNVYESLAVHLEKFCFSATAYHSGFPDSERDSTQRNWMAGLFQVWFFLN
jgi:superfamily II DNA helicase RecQ